MKLELQIELVEAASEFTAAEVMARSAREKVLRASRKLVNDPLLTDEEAIRKAGAEALQAVAEAAKR